MDKNISLKIGFKGQLALNAQVVPLQEGYLKLGGVVDTEQAGFANFGVVLSADPANLHVLKAGIGAGRVVRGVCVFDDAIAQNAPAHPDGYLPSMPCAVLSTGHFWLATWEKTATGATEPKVGGVVIASDTTGKIEFLESGEAPAGWTKLDAKIKDIDEALGALIYLQ